MIMARVFLQGLPVVLARSAPPRRYVLDMVAAYLSISWPTMKTILSTRLQHDNAPEIFTDARLSI
jgi:hypothetical protein